MQEIKFRGKILIKKALESFGYEIIKYRESKENISKYESCLLTLLSMQEKIKIAIVGANDGKTNDPAYNFLREHPGNSEVFLIEPQTELIPYLSENYKFHPNYQIFNCAIGPDEEITLFSIKRQFWSHLRVTYAKDWPIYRAPTGVTSSEKEHVERWLKKRLENPRLIQEAISEFTIPCFTLQKLLDKSGINYDIDVLQVDTEGNDDQSVYSCVNEQIKPRIVVFESQHLPKSRNENVEMFMKKNGYRLCREGDDTLAILPQYLKNT